MPPQNTLDIKGKLAPYLPAELLTEISQANLTGSLRLSSKKQKIIVYFDEGIIVFAVSNAREHRLFKILLRDRKISKEQLIKIENFEKDLYLAKRLVNDELLSQDVIDELFSFQIAQIVQKILTWETGDWVFNPLVRINRELRSEIDLNKLLFDYCKRLSLNEAVARFKNMKETFSLDINDNSLHTIDLSHDQEFILSRIGEQNRSLEEIITLSGIKRETVLKILYELWTSNFISRKNWDSQLKESDIQKINGAKVSLKTSASSIEKELAREKQKNAEKAKKEEKDIEKKQLFTDEYLNRIENASTYYEIFDVGPNADISKIKNRYFSYAKRFHPDLYYKKVSETVYKKMQDAFAEIVAAYETLKDSEARKTYDFKLREVLESYKHNTDSEPFTKGNFEKHKNTKEAREQFEIGYSLMLDGNYSKALSYLGRAVKFDDSVARYHAFYGKVLSFHGEMTHEAEAEIQSAIRLDPEKSIYKIILVELYIKVGLTARARGEIKRLLKSEPNNKKALSLLNKIGK